MNKRLFTPAEVAAFADPRDHLASPTTEHTWPVEYWLSRQPDRPTHPGTPIFSRSAYDPLELDEVHAHPVGKVIAISREMEATYGKPDGWTAVDLCNGQQLMVNVTMPDDYVATFLYTLINDEAADVEFCGLNRC